MPKPSVTIARAMLPRNSLSQSQVRRVEPELQLAERRRRRPPCGRIWRTSAGSSAGWRDRRAGRSRRERSPIRAASLRRRQRRRRRAAASMRQDDQAPRTGRDRAAPSAASGPRASDRRGTAAARSSSRSSARSTAGSPPTGTVMNKVMPTSAVAAEIFAAEVPAGIVAAAADAVPPGARQAIAKRAEAGEAAEIEEARCRRA